MCFLDLWIGFLFCILMEWKSFSYVRLFVTPWMVALQAPLSVEFSSKNTGVGNHSLLQGIFPTQGSNPGLLHCRQIPYHLSHQGSPLQLRRRTWLRWCGPCPFYGRLMLIRLTWGKMVVFPRGQLWPVLSEVMAGSPVPTEALKFWQLPFHCWVLFVSLPRELPDLTAFCASKWIKSVWSMPLPVPPPSRGVKSVKETFNWLILAILCKWGWTLWQGCLPLWKCPAGISHNNADEPCRGSFVREEGSALVQSSSLPGADSVWLLPDISSPWLRPSVLTSWPVATPWLTSPSWEGLCLLGRGLETSLSQGSPWAPPPLGSPP